VVRTLVLVLFVAGIAVWGLSPGVHGALLQVLDASREVITGHPVLGPVAFVLLAALSAFLTFFSSTVLIPVAVYAWGPWVTALLLWTGWMLGGAIAHALAFHFGRPLLQWLAPHESVQKYERVLRRHTSFAEILLFQMALPSELVGYGLGLARCPLHRYLAALAVAQLPYAVGTVLLGIGFVERDPRTMIAVTAIGLLLMVVLARVVQQRLRLPSRHRGDDEEREEDDQMDTALQQRRATARQRKRRHSE
jgi:uncharacterized membrane protein YdjX (TVP38/TMEM64 family)